MAELRPFKGIRYAQSELSDLIAPPYDVLDQKDKDALLARSAENIVSIDLPHMPPKTAGPQSAYDAAASCMSKWLADGTLKQDGEPAFYVYHQMYTFTGQSYTRRKFFARLRLEEFGSGHVFPHEQTFGGPKEDRLLLTRATQSNLSPIFGLYPDADNAVAAAFTSSIDRTPDATATMDGVENKLWVVTDKSTLNKVTALMADKDVFIADGHHRYGTALMYRQEQIKANGPLPSDHPANFVLSVMAGMEDPGLLILPTHRVLCGIPALTSGALSDALSEKFDIRRAEAGISGKKLVASLTAHGPLALAAYCSADKAAITLSPHDADMLNAYAPDRKPAWRRYSLSMLHRYILDEVVKPRFLAGADPTIHYIKDDNGAITEADSEKGIAFMPQSTTMAELRDICTAGELMPQKSTYFFPKLATGMIVNPLT